MKYLDDYLDRIRKAGNSELADAVQKTVNDIVPQYISNFDYMSHVVSLLYGEVQSGKTSHMFGLISAAADEGFVNFVLLTSNIELLQQQTLERAQRDLCSFCVCGESDYLKFKENKLKKPALVVLKKDANILRSWQSNFAGSRELIMGNPLFIADDEGDSVSLNTKVNRKQQSTINKTLEAIKKISSCSIYMEVTGTPQALLLQTGASGWKPYFVYYFKPGKGYIGGNFFFGGDKPEQIVLTDDKEAGEILSDGGLPENGLKKALISHLLSSGHIMLSGGKVCNFLIHPSIATKQHKAFAEKIKSYLKEIACFFNDPEILEDFEEVYLSLKETKPEILPLDQILEFIARQMQEDKIKILVMNSKVSFEQNNKYSTGINILIGGNSLGRGITIPQLQTVYYCRTSKRPQADTMWQHARMFGYDRDPGLMRVYMPPRLYKLFCDINRTDRSLADQIAGMESGRNVKMYYPEGLNPTRKNVLDKAALCAYTGEVNYFPLYPLNRSTEAIDNMLKSFEEGIYSVSIKFMKKLLEQTGSEEEDWNEKTFIGFLKSYSASDPSMQGKLIIRRGRDIGKGTGTLLSPNDRELGSSFPDEVVLTMYKITGNRSKGWEGSKIWIPNIKLPGNLIYYDTKS